MASTAGGGTVAARALLASVFVVMGAWRLYRATQGAPTSDATLAFSAGELVLGLLLLAGWRLRWTALAALALIAVDAALSHPFWAHAGAARDAQLLHFMKNAAIGGGFLLLALAAPRR